MVDREKYVEFINKYNQTFRNKKANYYKNFVFDNSSSTKAFWQKLNPFLNPNKKQKISSSLLNTNETNIQSSQDLVNVFSNFFSSILEKGLSNFFIGFWPTIETREFQREKK